MSLCSIVDNKFDQLLTQIKHGRLEVVPVGEEEVAFRNADSESFKNAVNLFDAWIDQYSHELVAMPVSSTECKLIDQLVKATEDKLYIR